MQKRTGRLPSGHLSRLKPVETDPLDEYGLPSKGENRLLVPAKQETFYTLIVSRYLQFCTEAGSKDELQRKFAELAISSSCHGRGKPSIAGKQPATTATRPPASPVLTSAAAAPNPSRLLSLTPIATISTTSLTTFPGPPNTSTKLASVSQILAALRKLREALVAAHRHDDFSTQVYLFSIRLGILSSAYETYHPALLRLLNHPRNRALLTSVEHAEVAAYLVLDAACRRGDLMEAYTLRNAHSLQDGKVNGALRALARDNWVLWRRVREGVDGYRAGLMGWAEPGVRGQALRAFGRAYLEVGRDFLERQTGHGWDELRRRDGVGWELVDGSRVIIRKVKGRS